MSLQIWLPLTDDLHNQGLSEINVINNGATLDNNGKIGKCYSLASGNYIGIDAANVNNHKYPIISIAMWVYPTQNDSTERFPICCYESGGCGISYKNSQFIFQIYSGGYKATSSQAVTLNQWYHVCGTYDGSTISIYINGQLQNTTTASGLITYHSTCPWEIGGNPGATSFGSGNFIGKINDVRIYDHALSPKEVEEISKGLVLHYKLNDTLQSNILTTNTTRTATVAAGGTNVYTSYWYLDTAVVPFIAEGTVLTVEYDYSVDMSTVTLNTTYLYSQFNTTAIVPNNSLLYSAMVTNPQGHKVDTFVVTEAQATYANSFRFRVRLNTTNEGATFTISNIRMYLGAFTPYVYDNSGYDNRGIITGTLKKSSDSPRYQSYTDFPDASSYFYFPHIVASDTMQNELTLATWIKRTYTDAVNRHYFYGAINAYIYSNFNFRIGWDAAIADGTYSSNTWDPGVNLPLNEWHHIVFTFKNGTFTCYLDGEYIGTSSRNPYIRGYRGTAASIGYTHIGGISDFRLYSTCLTAEQVKELYNTSAATDNEGNIHAREVVEI